jgi:hypothetical protein
MKHFLYRLTERYTRHLTDTEVVEAHEEEENEDPKSGFSNWEPLQGRCRALHPFSEVPRGAKKTRAPSINKDSIPLSVLM